MPRPISPDTPVVAAAGDHLEAGAPASATSRSVRRVPDLVADTVDLMNGVGEDAEERYQEQLAALRREAESVVASVVQAYRALDEDRYVERWGQVQLLSDLRHPAAADALRDILGQPIPPEQSPDPAHGTSTVGEEIIIRTTAVEALARLARDGDRTAVEGLRDGVSHDALSVRRAAVQAIADLGDDDLLEHVRRSLGEEEAGRLLSIRRLDVREAPQADGGRFLSTPDVPPPSAPRQG